MTEDRTMPTLIEARDSALVRIEIRISIWPTSPRDWALAFALVGMICLAVGR